MSSQEYIPTRLIVKGLASRRFLLGLLKVQRSPANVTTILCVRAVRSVFNQSELCVSVSCADLGLVQSAALILMTEVASVRLLALSLAF